MAAKLKTNTVSSFRKKPRVKRKGVHAKTKQSKNKSSKNYVKAYVSQGK
jgi:hypothetical protein